MTLPVDLENFVGKTVAVTLRDGTVLQGEISRNSSGDSLFPYVFESLSNFFVYTRSGFYHMFFSSDRDIVSAQVGRVRKTFYWDWDKFGRRFRNPYVIVQP